MGISVVMLAAECYRLAQGRWPESIPQIEEALSVKLPLDPFIPAPFRLKRTDDGLIIYSVGPDLRDNGGNLNNHKPNLLDIDFGYRLWDVDHRRRLP
ncbi:hypothetical protein ACYOEI_29465 [Singulisphaera rosea]